MNEYRDTSRLNKEKIANYGWSYGDYYLVPKDNKLDKACIYVNVSNGRFNTKRRGL